MSLHDQRQAHLPWHSPPHALHAQGTYHLTAARLNHTSHIGQQTPDLTKATNWSNANYYITTNETTKSATVPLTPTEQFFRLIE